MPTENHREEQLRGRAGLAGRRAAPGHRQSEALRRARTAWRSAVSRSPSA